MHIDLFACLSKKRHWKGKLESNEFGYLQGLYGTGVKKREWSGVVWEEGLKLNTNRNN